MTDLMTVLIDIKNAQQEHLKIAATQAEALLRLVTQLEESKQIQRELIGDIRGKKHVPVSVFLTVVACLSIIIVLQSIEKGAVVKLSPSGGVELIK
jgi:uncharacterized membrane protein